MVGMWCGMKSVRCWNRCVSISNMYIRYVPGLSIILCVECRYSEIGKIYNVPYGVEPEGQQSVRVIHACSVTVLFSLTRPSLLENTESIKESCKWFSTRSESIPARTDLVFISGPSERQRNTPHTIIDSQSGNFAERLNTEPYAHPHLKLTVNLSCKQDSSDQVTLCHSSMFRWQSSLDRKRFINRCHGVNNDIFVNQRQRNDMKSSEHFTDSWIELHQRWIEMWINVWLLSFLVAYRLIYCIPCWQPEFAYFRYTIAW